METRITELLKIEYPIMQAGLQHLGTPELASAVSNAGGLGTINATIYSSIPEFRDAIRKVKSLTTKPFCVNISMLPKVSNNELTSEYFRTVVEEGVAIVETAGRSPEEYVPMLKSAKVKLIHKVPAVKYAKKAEEVGADIVTIVGLECGGHPGMDEVTTMILGNKVTKTVNVPVFIGGGIADGYGMVAALALGGEGVVMGTRFVATEECMIHPNFKNWIVGAGENDTILIQRSIKNMVRAAKNEAALKCLAMEQQGAGLNELLGIISGKIGKECQMGGNVAGGILSAGQAIGLINEIKSAKQVVDDTMREVEMIIARLNQMMK
jgi:nitronate monooxygenase